MSPVAFDISILIVLYNCSPEESETIKSLSRTQEENVKAILCIWNNGPKPKRPNHETTRQLRDAGFECYYIETLENNPLSWIYNHFIKKFSAKKYVILDHDSKISKEYKTYILSKEQDFISVPLIAAKGIPRSPTVNGRFSSGPFSKDDCVIAIGSGLIVSDEAKNIISQKYENIFDEKYALYGVDTSFFLRVFRLGLSERVKTVPGFEHSLSRLEDETSIVKEFRKIERSYDFAITIRNYPEIRHIKYIANQIILGLIGQSSLKLKEAFNGIVHGRHPRCKEYLRKEFEKNLKENNNG